MSKREELTKEWKEKVIPHYAVPHDLRPHQIDAMSLLKQGHNVFLGTMNLH